MKFLKSLFLKLKAKKTLKTYQNPLIVTIITLVIINFLILMIGAFIGYIIDSKYYNNEFFDGRYIGALVTSVKWMIAPNTIISYDVHEHLAMLVLAAVVVVIEMVLFSGAIIAMVTTSLRKYIDKKSQAKGKILVSNHFVILNWNSKVPDIILNLMLKDYKNNIVILSNQSKEFIENEIKSVFLTNDMSFKSKINLIIKEGDTLLRSNLEDISIEKASKVCIMARDDMMDGDDDNIINSDLLNLKIVLRLGSFDINPNCQTLVETDSDITRGQIENLAFTVDSLKKMNIIPVSFNKKIGQIIAQTLVTPKMAEVYLDVFSFEGSEFYSVDYDNDIKDYMAWHNDAIPVAKYNKVFVLSKDIKDITKKRENPYICDKKFNIINTPKPDKCTIFVIGENKKSEFILENLRRSQELNVFDFELKEYNKNDNLSLVNDIKNTDGDKKVLILSDDQIGIESYDANVFVTLIELSKAFPKRENITFITELLDSRNLSSVKDFNIKNTIVSNKMMSLLITQLVMNDDSKKFFDKMLTTDSPDNSNDFDININKVSNMIEIEKDIVFENKAELLHTFYNTFNGKNILFAIYKKDELIFLDDNQDLKESLVISKDDSFVYFNY